MIFFFFNSKVVNTFLNCNIIQYFNNNNILLKNTIDTLFFKNKITIKFTIYFFNIFSILLKKIKILNYFYFNYIFLHIKIKTNNNIIFDNKKNKIFFDFNLIIFFQYYIFLKYLIKLHKLYINNRLI